MRLGLRFNDKLNWAAQNLRKWPTLVKEAYAGRSEKDAENIQRRIFEEGQKVLQDMAGFPTERVG